MRLWCKSENGICSENWTCLNSFTLWMETDAACLYPRISTYIEFRIILFLVDYSFTAIINGYFWYYWTLIYLLAKSSRKPSLCAISRNNCFPWLFINSICSAKLIVYFVFCWLIPFWLKPFSIFLQHISATDS